LDVWTEIRKSLSRKIDPIANLIDPLIFLVGKMEVES